jgi:hypothetical protein
MVMEVRSVSGFDYAAGMPASRSPCYRDKVITRLPRFLPPACRSPERWTRSHGRWRCADGAVSKPPSSSTPAAKDARAAAAAAPHCPARHAFHAGAQGDGSAVFISNLQWWTTDAELETLCASYGTVTGIRFLDDKACGKSRGMAIVEFAEAHAAEACIGGLNG